MEFLNAALTLLSTVVVAFLSYRLGQQQLRQTARSTELVDKTTGETEFRNSLLELLDSQEDKLTRQDVKIEKLDEQIEKSKNLTDELKRANFTLTLENHRLMRRTAELEQEVARLNTAVQELKEKQHQQEAINDAHR